MCQQAHSRDTGPLSGGQLLFQLPHPLPQARYFLLQVSAGHGGRLFAGAVGLDEKLGKLLRAGNAFGPMLSCNVSEPDLGSTWTAARSSQARCIALCSNWLAFKSLLMRVKWWALIRSIADWRCKQRATIFPQQFMGQNCRFSSYGNGHSSCMLKRIS